MRQHAYAKLLPILESHIPEHESRPGFARFGPFELDPRSGELRKHNIRLRLAEKPFRLLQLFLERAGDVVTREEMRRRLWPEDTFVEFDNGLNAAVNRLREALGDSAEKPRYIETLPKRGYRFIAPVEIAQSVVDATLPERGPEIPSVKTAGRKILWAALIASALILAALGVLWNHGLLRRRAIGHPGRLMLAVLPFENLSGDASQGYLSDGLTEEMITQLGKLKPERLGVIARTSSMHYKGSSQTAAEIGRELKVDYLLEGGVRREGTHVRISARLIRAPDETQLWARNYDGDVRDFLTLQSNVGADIVSGIELKLTERERAQLAMPRLADPKAHEDLLLGRFFWNKRTDEDSRKAIGYFEEAIRKDPAYSEAYAGLADSYTLLGLWGMSGEDAWQRAQAAAQKALELHPDLAEAHTSLGYIAMFYAWDWKVAEREFQRAIELDPNYATAHHGYAYYLMAVGRLEQSADELKRAQELDPLSMYINANVGFRLYFARQYDQAIDHWQKTLQLDPNFPLPHSYLSMAYEQKHLYKEAVEEAEKALELGGSPTNIASLGHVYGVMGKTQKAREQLRILRERSKQTFVPAFYIAYIYVGLGDADQAFQWLDRACKEHSGYLVDLKMDPSFDPVRPDPRFTVLLQRLHFPI